MLIYPFLSFVWFCWSVIFLFFLHCHLNNIWIPPECNSFVTQYVQVVVSKILGGFHFVKKLNQAATMCLWLTGNILGGCQHTGLELEEHMGQDTGPLVPQ
jgi:hypothetical protein